MDPISSLPADDKEEIVAESSPRGSRWTIEKRGDSQRLLTLALENRAYNKCMKLKKRMSSTGIDRTIIVPCFWCSPKKGKHLLLGDFCPIQFEDDAPGDSLAYVEATVKVKAMRPHNTAEVEVVWVAANAVARHGLRVGKVLNVWVGSLADFCFFSPADKYMMLRKLAHIDA